MLEVTLVMVDLSIAEHDLALWDGHQQARRPAAIFQHEYGVFPRAMTSNSVAAVVVEPLPSLSSARTHYVAPPHSATGHREDISAGRYCG